MTFIAKTQPWDGAKGGRFDSILRFTDPPNKKRVRDFFSPSQPLPPVLGECISVSTLPPTKPPVRCAGQNVVLPSRYRDNICICILNAPTRLLPGLKIVLSQLWAMTYGTKLKWEMYIDFEVVGSQEQHSAFATLSCEEEQRKAGVVPRYTTVPPHWFLPLAQLLVQVNSLFFCLHLRAWALPDHNNSPMVIR